MKSKPRIPMKDASAAKPKLRVVRLALLVVALLAFGLLGTACSVFDEDFELGQALNGIENDGPLRRDVTAAEKQYVDKDGFVSESNYDAALDAVAKAAKNDDSGVVKRCDRYDDCVRIEKTDGTVLIYQPNLEGTLACATDATCTIQTVEPHRNAFLKEDSRTKTWLDKVDSTAKTLAGVSQKWDFNKNMDDSSVTLKNFKDLGASADTQIIYWMGHGCWTKEEGGILWLYETDASKYPTEYKAGEIVESVNGHIGVTPKYVKQNVKGLDGALVVLCSCQVGKDSKMADAFISAGASTVLAFTETVRVTYGCDLTSAFLMNLCTPNASGVYPTSSEALGAAKSTCGDSDSAHGARGTLYGKTFQITGPKKQDQPANNTSNTNTNNSSNNNSGNKQSGLGAYADVLAGYNSSAKFQLVDLKKDGTPELIVSTGNSHVNGVDIYGLDNGRAVKLLETGGTFGDALVICDKAGQVLEDSVYGGVETCKLYVLDGEAFSLRFSAEGDFSGSPSASKFVVNNQNVSKDRCRKAIDEQVNKNWTKVGYSTGHPNTASNRNALASNPKSLY